MTLPQDAVHRARTQDDSPSPRRRGRLLRLLLVAIGILAATGGWLAWRHHSQPYHFDVVTPGVLYRSGTLSKSQLADVLDEHGIKTVVNLRSHAERANEEWYEEEVEACRAAGATLLDMPHHYGQSPSQEAIGRFLALFDDEANLPVLVHCEHGVLRTGMMVAAYDMEVLHKTNAEALRDLKTFGHPPYKSVEQFVLGYVCRSQREGTGEASLSEAQRGASRR